MRRYAPREERGEVRRWSGKSTEHVDVSTPNCFRGHHCHAGIVMSNEACKDAANSRCRASFDAVRVSKEGAGPESALAWFAKAYEYRARAAGRVAQL